MATENTCPHCGKPVPATALQGICPECMLQAGLADTGEVGPEGTLVMRDPSAAPRVEDLAAHFPHLEILECLGRGGMGAVYKARQPKLDRFVALKVLSRKRDNGTPDAEFAQRFEREARALARLNHPDIVAVYDFGEAGGFHYLLMEYVDGLTLRQLLQTRKLSPEEALAIVPKICEALQFAHERGIVHRDIKPENILLDTQGCVKIADFGIAKIMHPLTRPADTLLPSAGERAGVRGESLTGPKDVLGTPHYMAPEQIEKPATVDHRADIYSLGVVFYEMLTGELPLGKFAAPSKKVQVDVRLDEVVLHALEKEPERRYQYASEVKTDVETIATTPAAPFANAPTSSPPLRGAPRGPTPGSKPDRWEIGILASGLTVFVILLMLIPTASPPFRDILAVLCAVGLTICFLRLAGLWPLPSFLVADSGFSGRNLRRAKGLIYIAFFCACLSILVPVIFYWYAPWLVPWLTALGQQFMLWLTLIAAFIALILGFAARTFRLGKAAIVMGGISLTLWLLFFVAGLFSTQPFGARTRSQVAKGSPTMPAREDSQRKFVRVVADPAALTFEGQATTWAGLAALLAKTPDRTNTVLEFAVTSDQITVAQQNEWFQKAAALARQHGFEYASFIGIHPLGSRGTSSSTNGTRLDAQPESDRRRALALFDDIEDFGHEFDAAFTSRNLAAAQTGTRRLLNLLTNFNETTQGTDLQFPAGLFEDITKVQRALDAGDWEQARRLARHNEEYARAFQRIGERMVEWARQSSPAAHPPGSAALPENVPPVVIETTPPAGAVDVNPGLAEIRVTFSKDMLTNRMWAVCQVSAAHFPERNGPIHYVDRRTCIVPVKLQPGRTYALWFNLGQFDSFRDTRNQPALPYPLYFQTRK